MLPPRNPDEILKARGADTRPRGRYEREERHRESDGWDIDEDAALLRTEVTLERARSAISWNASPDLPFDRSVNPYRGCEHGCIYCYARPMHAYLGLSPGLDFETRITARPGIGKVLAREFGRKGYKVAPLALGTATDPYQPAESRHRVTREVLEVASAWNHPLTIVTRGQLITRDLDLLAPMAACGLVSVGVSVTTLDPVLSRSMEPRAPAPSVRLGMIRALADAGVPVRVMVAPVIPGLTDTELETILAAAAEAGAGWASMIPLRLPLEVAPLFRDWLERRLPLRAAHVMNRLHAMRAGRDNDPRFGHRMRGEGIEADLLHQRFRLACRRLGMNESHYRLDCSGFARPPGPGDQLNLF